MMVYEGKYHLPLSCLKKKKKKKNNARNHILLSQLIKSKDLYLCFVLPYQILV
jgi:hypothetical protein